MRKRKMLVLMAMFTAIGTYGSTLLWFPGGIAKAYPVQHALNVISVVLLGPYPAVIIAFTTSIMRNLMGTGTLLAFPGSMIGALLAGYFFSKTSRIYLAALGEFIGTGIIASLVAVPYSSLLLGTNTGALYYMPSFIISSLAGAIIGCLLLSRLMKISQIETFIRQ